MIKAVVKNLIRDERPLSYCYRKVTYLIVHKDVPEKTENQTPLAENVKLPVTIFWLIFFLLKKTTLRKCNDWYVARTNLIATDGCVSRANQITALG